MGDVGDHVVGLFEHPVVTPGNGVMWVDGFNTLREHRIGIVLPYSQPRGSVGSYGGAGVSMYGIYVFGEAFVIPIGG